MKHFQTSSIYLAVIALMALVAFYPALNAGFVWDDLTVQTYQVPFQKSLGDAFAPSQKLVGSSNSYYRPVVTLAYMLGEALNNAVLGETSDDKAHRTAGERARIPHTLALLVHIFASMAVFWLLQRFYPKSPLCALASACFFVVYPLHSEAAAAIMGLSDTLATLFLLGCILAAAKSCEGRHPAYLSASAALFLLALLSKEVALAGILLVPLTLYILGMERRGIRNVVAGLFAALVCYLALRWNAGVTLAKVGELDFTEATGRILKGFFFYLDRLFWPFPARPYIPEVVGPGLIGIAVFALLALTAYKKGGKKELLFCSAWFAIALAPALAVLALPVSQTPLSDRYLFLPSVSLAIAAGWILTTFDKVKWGAVCIALVVFAGFANHYSRIWSDNLTFFTALTLSSETQNHPLPWGNLGNEHLARGETDLALEDYRKALRLVDPANAPQLARAHASLGLAYYDKGVKFEQASDHNQAMAMLAKSLEHYQQAVALQNPDWITLKNMAQTKLRAAEIQLAATGGFDRQLVEIALEEVALAKALSPGNPKVLAVESHARRLLGN